MSFLKKLFGQEDAGYEVPPAKYDYDYYSGLRATGDTAKDMLNSVNKPNGMPPLEHPQPLEHAPKSQQNVKVQNTPLAPPVDAEAQAYDAWVKDTEQTAPAYEKPAIGKPNVLTAPTIPAKPKVEPVVPTKGNSPKAGPNSFTPKHSSWQPKPFVPKIPEKEVFALVVENSSSTFKQKERIASIISQALERKKDAIFLFVKVGNDKQPFIPMDYTSVKEKDIVSSLITQNETDELPNLASALFYLANNLNVFAADTFSFGNNKYKLGNCSIVCIGTGACVCDEDSQNIISSCISRLQNIPKLKSFKYFCIKDTDAIRVSALGFPVIGHIISDFYE